MFFINNPTSTLSNDGSTKQLDKKPMLTIHTIPSSIGQRSERTLVRINYSSLNLLQTCKRKSKYKLIDNLSIYSEADALVFGKAIHKALEHWYSLPLELRKFEPSNELIEAWSRAEMLEHEAPSLKTAMGSLHEFVLCARNLVMIPPQEKRSLKHGLKILQEYFKIYAEDPYITATDEKGLPMVEKSFEFTLYSDDELQINYFGTIDLILKHTATNHYVIVDHKTSSTLGQEFANRTAPNHQITGYLMGAKSMGFPANEFIINGLQVAKTKMDFMRVVTSRTELEFYEFTEAVYWSVREWLACNETKYFPLAGTQACSAYGGCEYQDVCKTSPEMRMPYIASKYGQGL